MKATRNHPLVSLIAVIALGLAGCEGREAALAALADRPPVVDAGPPPVVTGRVLVDKKVFGTLPVQNRFEDPLMTMTGTSWFAYANSFRAYPVFHHRVSPSPSATPFVDIPGPANQGGEGATLLGQLKVSRGPLHVELWVGREGVDAELGDVSVALAGLFVGQGETSVDLNPDSSSTVVVENRTWVRFAADVEEGPVGWAYLVAGDVSASPRTVFLGGPAAVDGPANPNAALRAPLKRAWSARERQLISAVRERTQQLGAPARPLRPALVPGVPPGR